MQYQIVSANPLFPMSIEFINEDGKTIVIDVNIDYIKERVFFKEIDKNIDIASLEQDILSALRPDIIEPPKLPEELFEYVSKARSGYYESSVKTEAPDAPSEQDVEQDAEQDAEQDVN